MPYEVPYSFGRTFRLAFILAGLASLLARESPPPLDVQSQVRYLVGDLQFDFVDWTLDALAVKVGQSSLSEQRYLSVSQRKDIVLDYLDLIAQIEQRRGEIEAIYVDPSHTDPAAIAAPVEAELARLEAQRETWQPTAEAILQEQIAAGLHAQGFTVLGQPLPPVAFHSTPLPTFLVVSARERIERIASAEIETGLTAADEEGLEAEIDQALNVRSLVVPLGGIGTYPTMLYETSNLNAILEIGAHEWCHNYLTLRPLGLNYDASGELRTMNETTCSLFGKEIGAEALARFYPERVPPPPPPQAETEPPETPEPPPPPAFDFNAEMRKTRVRVDELLAQGEVERAEDYMEARRRLFVEQGYLLRKLNQAYFAFYGSYADRPGAGGQDPVGPAVTALRERSPSLKAFIDRIAWMTSFEQLQEALAEGEET
jgi:hypothetical protein